MADQNRSDVVNSKAFERALHMAEKYAGNALHISHLLTRASAKAGRHEGALHTVWDYLKAMQRLLRANLRREYTVVPWRSVVFATAALFYLVSPLDFVPDFVPLGGLLDDVTIIAYVISQIRVDLDQFLAWEASKRQTIEGEFVG